MSWQFMFSAIESLRSSASQSETIDLNSNAPACAILGCIALEAFSNEIPSLTDSFISNVKKDYQIESLSSKQIESEFGINWNICKKIADIKNEKYNSFYDRYKDHLIKEMQISQPEFIQELTYLRDLRNALVHYRLCDAETVVGEDGVIKFYQEPPEVFNHIKSKKVKNWPVIASDVEENSPWTKRISTNAMAIWSLKLIIDSIVYILDSISPGKYKDSIIKPYKARDKSFENVFRKGEHDIQHTESGIFDNK